MLRGTFDRYTWVVRSPGGRRGREVWLGPIGIGAHWPDPCLMWNWGWWRLFDDAS